MTIDSALTKTVVLRVYDDDDHKPADHLGEVSQYYAHLEPIRNIFYRFELNNCFLLSLFKKMLKIKKMRYSFRPRE